MPVQIVTNPLARPNICVICSGGQHNRDWFVDLGIDTYDYNVTDQERQGVIYICNLCFAFIALSANFLEPTQAQKLQHENELLFAANELLNDRNVKLIQAIETLQEAGFVGSLHPSGDTIYSDSPTELPVLEDVESESDELSVGEERLADRESGTFKSSYGKFVD